MVGFLFLFCCFLCTFQKSGLSVQVCVASAFIHWAISWASTCRVLKSSGSIYIPAGNENRNFNFFSFPFGILRWGIIQPQLTFDSTILWRLTMNSLSSSLYLPIMQITGMPDHTQILSSRFFTSSSVLAISVPPHHVRDQAEGHIHAGDWVLHSPGLVFYLFVLI